MDKHLLSKDNSLIVRGLAILSIVFHNYLHFYRFGFAQENEFSFSVEKAVGFFSYLREGHIFANCLSFLGWLGVPIFIFLTGYGFAKKEIPENRKGWKKDFIKHGFLNSWLCWFRHCCFSLRWISCIMTSGRNCSKGLPT